MTVPALAVAGEVVELKSPGRPRKETKRKRKPTRYHRIQARDVITLEFVRVAKLATTKHIERHLMLHPEVWTVPNDVRLKTIETGSEPVPPSWEVVKKHCGRLARGGFLKRELVAGEYVFSITKKGLAAIDHEDVKSAQREAHSPKLRHTLGIGGLVNEVIYSLRERKGMFARQFACYDPTSTAEVEEEMVFVPDHFIEASRVFYKQELGNIGEELRKGWASGLYGEPEFAEAEAWTYAMVNLVDVGTYSLQVPDLVVVLPRPGKTFAIEFERSTKSDLDAYRTKLVAYDASPVYSEFYYVVSVKAVRTRIEYVLKQLGWSQQEVGEKKATWVSPGGTLLHFIFLDRKLDRLHTEWGSR